MADERPTDPEPALWAPPHGSAGSVAIEAVAKVGLGVAILLVCHVGWVGGHLAFDVHEIDSFSELLSGRYVYSEASLSRHYCLLGTGLLQCIYVVPVAGALAIAERTRLVSAGVILGAALTILFTGACAALVDLVDSPVRPVEPPPAIVAPASP